MSLVAWYPLNGNLNNQGCKEINATFKTTAAYTTGKVTTNALNNSAGTQVITVPYTPTNTEISIALWVNSQTPTGWTDIVSWGNNDRIEVSTAAGQYYFYTDNNTNSLYNSGTLLTNNLTDKTWHHFVMTANGTTVKFYLDGTLINSGTQKNPLTTAFANKPSIKFLSRQNDGNIFKCYLNDVRIYNHCLSLKEVKELANNQAAFNLYKDESKVRGNSSSSSYTKTKLIGEDGYNYKGTYTGTGGNSWANIGFGGVGRENIVPGTSYTWTCKIRIHKWTGDTLSLRNSIIGNDYTNGSVQVANTTLPKNVWLTFTRTKTLTEGMKNGSTTYYITDSAYNASTASPKAYMNPLVEFYTGSRTTSGFVYEVDFDLKDIKLMKTEDYNKLSNIPASIDNTGNIFTNEFIETTKNSVEKEGLIKTAHFMENYITEPDGAVFQQIAFHLDPTSYKFASSDNFNDCYIDCRRWFNAKICDLADKWEFLLIQRELENTNTLKFRWSQTKNPNTATYEDTVSSAVTKNTSSIYSTASSYGGVYKFNSNIFYCFNNGSKGNWFGIGAWGSHQGGIPGYAGKIIKDGGFQSLYIRIDNLSNTSLNKIHAQIKKNTNTIISNQFYEFI